MIGSILILLVVFLYVSFNYENLIPKKEPLKVDKTIIEGEFEKPLSVDGFYKVENVDVKNNKILLSKGCNVSVITTTTLQTNSIEKGIKGLINYRPEVHDVIYEILSNYNFDILMVKVNKLERETYFAELIIKKDNKILDLDIKPSDAISIAVRGNAPIYVKKEFFKYNKEKC